MKTFNLSAFAYVLVSVVLNQTILENTLCLIACLTTGLALVIVGKEIYSDL